MNLLKQDRAQIAPWVDSRKSLKIPAMGKLEFLLGSACLVAPQGHLLFVGVVAVRGACAIYKHLSSQTLASPAPGADLDLDQPVPPVELKWSGLSSELRASSGAQAKEILKGVTGVARPGRLLAIMVGAVGDKKWMY